MLQLRAGSGATAAKSLPVDDVLEVALFLLVGDFGGGSDGECDHDAHGLGDAEGLLVVGFGSEEGAFDPYAGVAEGSELRSAAQPGEGCGLSQAQRNCIDYRTRWSG